MIKKFYLALTFLFITQLAFSQSRSHVFYAEALGNGIIYSLNYDVRFLASYRGLGLRIGGGVTPDDTFLPVQLNFVIGRKHALEIGGGYIITLNSKTTSKSEANPGGCLMYRYQSDRGFNFRIGWTPSYIKVSKDSYIKEDSLTRWLGLSLGYRL